jgi:hypothetical protein
MQVAGLARDAGIGGIAADHRVEGAVAADLLVDDDIDQDVTLEVDAELLEILHSQDMAGDAALHIA